MPKARPPPDRREKDREERLRLEEARLEKERFELEKVRLELEKERETLRNLREMKPKPASPAEAPAAGEFVFSTSEIEAESPLTTAAEGAQTAEIYDTAASLAPNYPERQAA